MQLLHIPVAYRSMRYRIKVDFWQCFPVANECFPLENSPGITILILVFFLSTEALAEFKITTITEQLGIVWQQLCGNNCENSRVSLGLCDQRIMGETTGAPVFSLIWLDYMLTTGQIIMFFFLCFIAELPQSQELLSYLLKNQNGPHTDP